MESYAEHIDHLETSLASYAKRSIEAFSPTFVDGAEIYEVYSKQWEDSHRRQRLLKRTPLQIERDRIIHAPITRKLAEKYQVLYNGPRRVVRNYSTHVNRLVQVARAMCRWLDLNGDFAEAIALGSKTGALPFVHASKEAVSTWIQRKIKKIDDEFAPNDPRGTPAPAAQLQLDFGDATLPSWLQGLRSPRVVEKVQKYIPWAAGSGMDAAHSTGQQAYWMLATNPFTLESRPKAYSPETMFAVWRHTLGSPSGRNSFLHKMTLSGAATGKHAISWQHNTYEGLAVAYADDITWVIENLNDANAAALLNRKKGVFEALLSELGTDIPDGLVSALAHGDAGALYTYFIADFNDNSSRVLKTLASGSNNREALRNGSSDALIGLSQEALAQLSRIKTFLEGHVFDELRVSNRTKMLRTLSEACMDLLYEGSDDILPNYLKDRANIERWPDVKRDRALSIVNDPVHRVQLAVDVFCEMGDQEIYDFVGIDSL